MLRHGTGTLLQQVIGPRRFIHRAIVRYALEVNDPWLANSDRRSINVLDLGVNRLKTCVRRAPRKRSERTGEALRLLKSLMTGLHFSQIE